MTEPAKDLLYETHSQGAFRYMAPSAESSLYRNGRVLTRRDRDGSDSGFEGIDLESREMAIVDARGLPPAEHPTLAANGFELLERPTAHTDLDFLDHEAVVRTYYPECVEIMKAATGATVAAFDHNVRSASGKSDKRRIAGGQQVQGPAHVVHGDYTLTSAPQRLRDLARPPTLNDTYRSALAEGETLLDSNDVERGHRRRSLRPRQPLAQHRPRAGGDPAARAVRRRDRAAGRAGRVRNPLSRPDRRELFR